MGVHLELTIGPATAPAHELNITVNLGALSPRGCTANPLPTLFDALAIAAHKHCDQRRKDADATPYINHPIALARILSVEGGIVDPVVLTAAILHDAIEETETTADELRAGFGSEVTGVVLEVTDDTASPKVDRKRLQVERAPHIS